MIHLIINILPYLIVSMSLCLAGSLFLVLPYIPAALLAPGLFILIYILCAGIPTLPCHHAIRKGRFKRSAGDKVYKYRLVYGKCWSMVYYFTPLYQIILHNRFLKWLTFRIFGYKGSLNFTTYPDTWVRDLCCLKLGEGSYLSNRATIGTNIVQKSGHILVDEIQIGKGSVVGHLAILGPGAKIGDNSEVGVNCIIGIRTRIGNGVVVKPGATVYHASILADGVTVEPEAYVGVHCIVRKNITIPSGAVIPDGTVLNTQEDVKKFEITRSSEVSGTNIKRRPTDLIQLKK